MVQACRQRGVSPQEYLAQEVRAIREVWLVDLDSCTITTYRQPAAGRYQQSRTLEPGQQVSVAAFPTITIAVHTILGEKQA